MRCNTCGRDFPSEYYFKAPGMCLACWNSASAEQRREAFRPSGMRRMTTTAFTLDGYRTVETLGVVRGVTVRSRSILGTIGAGLQTLLGGNISLFSELCEKTRAEAFDMMITHAEAMGANAIVGVRYDATEVMDGVTEVLCYGTAVIVQPEQQATPS